MKQIVLAGLLCLFSIQVFGQKKNNSIRFQYAVISDDNSEIDNSVVVIHNADSSRRFLPSNNLFWLPLSGKYFVSLTAPGFYHDVMMINIIGDTFITFTMKENVLEYQNVTIKAVNVREKSGFVFSKMTAKQLSSVNLGQDFTYLIGNTPSAVTTSDAGSGIGYTGIRIRGSDATRINVTVNGIPINDAESHGVFWVNMPDLAASTSYVQIQRGVGSSTIGTGAFGANINIINAELSSAPFVQLQQSFGSFNTSRSTMMFGTGKLGNFNFSGRLSKIMSDGYIDRAASNLQSFQFNLNYRYKKWNINALSFGGKEKTYQSWYGTPESRVKNDVQGMNDYADRNGLSDAERNRLLSSGRTYNYYTYENQTDNYWQNHYHLHLNRELNKYLFLKSSFFLTAGKGYYEEFKETAEFAAYGASDFISGSDTISSTDLVRQRWLNNLYYGNFSSLNYKRNDIDAVLGVSYTEYDGKHFGDVVWAGIAQPFGKDFRYYESKSLKTELNGFVKVNYKINQKLQLDGELQLRQIQYRSKGKDNDLKTIDYDTSYLFFNPKLGAVYEFNRQHRVYGSYSIGQREPVRSDFIDQSTTGLPKPEKLQDIELGYIYKNKGVYLQLNVYNMIYKNQLVLTGELNDVGSSLRKNVSQSFRRGLELIVQYPILKDLMIDANLNLSQNQIKNFEDVYYNYDNGTVIKDVYQATDIAFSPSAVVFVGLTDRHLKGTELNLNIKYVGSQYLDNTLNKARMLDAYYMVNFAVQKSFQIKSKNEIVIRGILNNLNGIFYSNNGYTYKYVYSGKLITENFHYPQSGINFLLGIDFKFL